MLESVLGATPQQFESPILRYADLQRCETAARVIPTRGSRRGLNTGTNCELRQTWMDLIVTRLCDTLARTCARAPEPALPRITCSVILPRVIASFRDRGTEDLFDGRDTKRARKACPSDLVRVARRKLDQLNQAVVLGDLRAPPGDRPEKLKSGRGGQYSIRINDQWRVCFRWAGSGAEDVEIVDYQ